MKYKLIILITSLFLLFALSSTAQEDEKWYTFEQHPPFRQLKCGLWINQAGNIAYKYQGCEVDSLGELVAVDKFQMWTYNIKDGITDDMTEDDYISLLKDVVDTASFKILNGYYFRDKNHIYIYPVMACGGPMFVGNDLDIKTFRTLKENPDYACDKNNCYVTGRYIEGADPATFRIIPNDEITLSRDKNHFYEGEHKMNEKEVAIYEQKLGINLFTQADVMNFTTSKFDSIKITYTVSIDKETSSLGDTVPENRIVSEQSARLTTKETETLSRYLLSPRSFTDAVPLLPHGDISISYYKGDTVAVYCSISSLTRRFTLINGVRIFKKSISPKFEKYITGLLRSKGIFFPLCESRNEINIYFFTPDYTVDF